MDQDFIMYYFWTYLLVLGIFRNFGMKLRNIIKIVYYISARFKEESLKKIYQNILCVDLSHCSF